MLQYPIPIQSIDISVRCNRLNDEKNIYGGYNRLNDEKIMREMKREF